MNAMVNHTPFQSPLSSSEEAELRQLDPDFEQRASTYAHMFNSRALYYTQQTRDLETSVLNRVRRGETVDLTDEELVLVVFHIFC